MAGVTLTDKTGTAENVYTISVGDLELDAAALVALVDKVNPASANKVTVSSKQGYWNSRECTKF